MKMREIKREIVKEFRNEFGFAPLQKDIIPLEYAGSGEDIDWIAFCIRGIGYTYDHCLPSFEHRLAKSEMYDLQ